MPEVQDRHRKAAEAWASGINRGTGIGPPNSAYLNGARDGYAQALADQGAEIVELLVHIESGEEAEYVDGMEGSEGCYEYTFEDGQRFVLDRIRALLSKGASR